MQGLENRKESVRQTKGLKEDQYYESGHAQRWQGTAN